jgi:hypothetical protein
MRGEKQEYEKLNTYKETRVVTSVVILCAGPEEEAVASKVGTPTDKLGLE